MTNNAQLLPLPEPDTHCFDEDTQTDCWSHSPGQMESYALACIEAAKPADALVEAVRNLRKVKGRFHTEQAFTALMEALATYEAAQGTK